MTSCNGKFRNLESGVQPLACEAHVKILGLAKCLEISKELIRECVTVPGCCHIPLLYNHLMDSCSYLSKNALLATKGGAFAPPKSATVL